MSNLKFYMDFVSLVTTFGHCLRDAILKIPHDLGEQFVIIYSLGRDPFYAYRGVSRKTPRVKWFDSDNIRLRRHFWCNANFANIWWVTNVRKRRRCQCNNILYRR
uniref:Uncharacterized protein n=1 Tax=Pararge aegeria TaxID=116150 RepID=S4PJ67_9NEOP